MVGEFSDWKGRAGEDGADGCRAIYAASKARPSTRSASASPKQTLIAGFLPSFEISSKHPMRLKWPSQTVSEKLRTLRGWSACSLVRRRGSI